MQGCHRILHTAISLFVQKICLIKRLATLESSSFFKVIITCMRNMSSSSMAGCFEWLLVVDLSITLSASAVSICFFNSAHFCSLNLKLEKLVLGGAISLEDGGASSVLSIWSSRARFS